MSSDKLLFEGCTTVEGVSVQVTLVVDTVGLIHKLGAKAARNRGRLAALSNGRVFATVSREDSARVSAAVRARRQRAQS